MIPPDRGTTTRHSVPSSEFPSRAAASRSSFGEVDQSPVEYQDSCRQRQCSVHNPGSGADHLGVPTGSSPRREELLSAPKEQLPRQLRKEDPAGKSAAHAYQPVSAGEATPIERTNVGTTASTLFSASRAMPGAAGGPFQARPIAAQCPSAPYPERMDEYSCRRFETQYAPWPRAARRPHMPITCNIPRSTSGPSSA